MPPLITLLTDFGLRDTYVAEMKGVLLGAAPGATLVDITHEVAPGDVAGFSRAVGSLVRDTALRERLAAAGPARAAEFSVARMVDGTSHSYQVALDSARRAWARHRHLGRSV